MQPSLVQQVVESRDLVTYRAPWAHASSSQDVLRATSAHDPRFQGRENGPGFLALCLTGLAAGRFRTKLLMVSVPTMRSKQLLAVQALGVSNRGHGPSQRMNPGAVKPERIITAEKSE